MFMRRILEATSQNSIDKLLRSLRTSDYFESVTKTELDHPEDPEDYGGRLRKNKNNHDTVKPV